MTSPSPAPEVGTGLHRRIRIDSRVRRFPDLREVLRYRQLAVVMGRRDITVRYRQTVLGTVWIFGGAIVTAGLFSFVFGRIAELPSDGVPYFAFSFAGLVGWNLFSQVLTGTSSSLSAGLITKIYFPRLVMPLSGLASTLLNTAISTCIMLVLLVVFDIGFTFQLLLVPVWLLLAVVLALGVGLVLASFAVEYRDVNYITPVVMSLLLYLTPVAYSLEAVPDNLRNLYLLNPVASIVAGLRWSFLGCTSLPPVWAMAYMVAFTLGAALVGLAVFARREATFADVI